MTYRPLLFSLFLLALVWAGYFLNFHGGVSDSPGDWGTFGDFTGGVLNPLLNFITIYLLITQYKTARDDLEVQRSDERVKAFESSFFTFATFALNEYRSYELTAFGSTYKSSEAVTYIEKYVATAARAGVMFKDFDKLDTSANDTIYSLVASFCVVFKLIEESCPVGAKSKYVNLFVMMLPAKIIFLLAISKVATKWAILDYPDGLGFFERDTVLAVVSHFETLRDSTPQI